MGYDDYGVMQHPNFAAVISAAVSLSVSWLVNCDPLTHTQAYADLLSAVPPPPLPHSRLSWASWCTSSSP